MLTVTNNCANTVHEVIMDHEVVALAASAVVDSAVY